MTIQDMHQTFYLLLDRSNTGIAPEFLPEEVDKFINISIDRFIKNRYQGTNFLSTSFEETQKRTNDLRRLVTLTTITKNTPGLNFYSNTVDYTLPSDFFVALSARAEAVFKNDCNKEITELSYTREVQQDDLTDSLIDPFIKPEKSRVLLITVDNKLIFFHHKDTVLNSLKLSYIKLPVQVSLTNSINCDLAEHTHLEIVQMSVNLALETFDAQRYQTNSVELTKIE